MSKYTADNVPTPADGQKKATWYTTLVELAAKGVSTKSIAARLGISYSDFMLLVETYPQVKAALELARAEFEIIRVEAKDTIMNDPNTSNGLKYKIIREDLKTIEEWAPATRAGQLENDEEKDNKEPVEIILKVVKNESEENKALRAEVDALVAEAESKGKSS